MDKDYSLSFKDLTIFGGVLSFVAFTIALMVWFTGMSILDKTEITGACLVIVVGYLWIVTGKINKNKRR